MFFHVDDMNKSVCIDFLTAAGLSDWLVIEMSVSGFMNSPSIFHATTVSSLVESVFIEDALTNIYVFKHASENTQM